MNKELWLHLPLLVGCRCWLKIDHQPVFYNADLPLTLGPLQFSPNTPKPKMEWVHQLCFRTIPCRIHFYPAPRCSLLSWPSFFWQSVKNQFSIQIILTLFLSKASFLCFRIALPLTVFIFQQYLLRLRTRKKLLSYCWVPSHVNVPGNEQRDKAGLYTDNLLILSFWIFWTRSNSGYWFFVPL